MLKLWKLSFWVPYEDTAVYPTVQAAHQAIAEDCRKNNRSCRFSDDDTAVIDGEAYEILRGYEPGSRGSYGIKCRKK